MMLKFLTSLILLGSIFIATLATTVNAANKTKLVLPLIHWNSILSPLYNSKHTISTPPQDIRADLVPYNTGTFFLVNVSIGEPPLPQLLIFDTGSPLTWVCTDCAPGMSPVFDPSKSSTYVKIPCSSLYDCVGTFSNSDCRQDLKSCTYSIRYEDQSRSIGVLATEKFTFETSTGGIVELGNLAFGVGIANPGNKMDGINGIIGIETINTDSLVSRLGRKFSYCMGNISDPQYMHNKLILGEGAIIQGYSTPMKISEGHYKVKLEGITVGDKQLQINQQDFDFNVVVDTGTTITQLRRSGFEPLKKEVQKLMDGWLQPVEVSFAGERPCYQGNIVRDLRGFPIVTLHLFEGADIDLDGEAMFHMESDNVFCMAVDVNDGVNIIGVLAQQHYNVGFNLNEDTISFQRIDCELLED